MRPVGMLLLTRECKPCARQRERERACCERSLVREARRLAHRLGRSLRETRCRTLYGDVSGVLRVFVFFCSMYNEKYKYFAVPGIILKKSCCY